MTISDTGIILKRFNYGEADKILSVLTQYSGKVSVIAKGIRKITSKRGGNLELFNEVRFSFTESEGLGIVTEVETLNVFENMKKDWGRVGQIYLACEVVDRLVPEREKHRKVYDLLRNLLESINTESDHEVREVLLRDFEVAILSDLGYWSEKEYGDKNHLTNGERRKFNLTLIEHIMERELRSSGIFESN